MRDFRNFDFNEGCGRELFFSQPYVNKTHSFPLTVAQLEPHDPYIELELFYDLELQIGLNIFPEINITLYEKEYTFYLYEYNPSSYLHKLKNPAFLKFTVNKV